jgi:hypothetical protein
MAFGISNKIYAPYSYIKPRNGWSAIDRTFYSFRSKVLKQKGTTNEIVKMMANLIVVVRGKKKYK